MNPQEVLDALAEGRKVGATLCYPQDRYPYLIVGATRSGKTINLSSLPTDAFKAGFSPAGFHNGFPVWDHTWTEEEMEAFLKDEEEPISRPSRKVIKARWSTRFQRWTCNGTPIHVGHARYFRDYSD